MASRMYSMHSTAPPRRSISSISSRARSSISAVRRSTYAAAPERVDRVGDARLGGDHLLGAQRELGRLLGRAGPAPRRTRWSGSTGRRRAPPPAPARATRTTLLRGCWAVSVLPPVWAWKRRLIARGSVAPKRSRMMCAHRRAGRAELGDLLQQVVVGVEEERQPRAEAVHLQPRGEGGLDVGDAVGQRERDLLHRRRARLADVVAADRDRVPAAAARRRSRRTCRS